MTIFILVCICKYIEYVLNHNPNHEQYRLYFSFASSMTMELANSPSSKKFAKTMKPPLRLLSDPT